MSALGTVGNVLAWPSSSGVLGGAILGAVAGVPAVVAFWRRLAAQHRERLSQAERHHAERQAQATAHHNALTQHLTATLRLPAKQPRVPARPKGGD